MKKLFAILTATMLVCGLCVAPAFADITNTSELKDLDHGVNAPYYPTDVTDIEGLVPIPYFMDDTAPTIDFDTPDSPGDYEFHLYGPWLGEDDQPLPYDKELTFDDGSGAYLAYAEHEYEAVSMVEQYVTDNQSEDKQFSEIESGTYEAVTETEWVVDQEGTPAWTERITVAEAYDEQVDKHEGWKDGEYLIADLVDGKSCNFRIEDADGNFIREAVAGVDFWQYKYVDTNYGTARAASQGEATQQAIAIRAAAQENPDVKVTKLGLKFLGAYTYEEFVFDDQATDVSLQDLKDIYSFYTGPNYMWNDEHPLVGVAWSTAMDGKPSAFYVYIYDTESCTGDIYTYAWSAYCNNYGELSFDDFDAAYRDAISAGKWFSDASGFDTAKLWSGKQYEVCEVDWFYIMDYTETIHHDEVLEFIDHPAVLESGHYETKVIEPAVGWANVTWKLIEVPIPEEPNNDGPNPGPVGPEPEPTPVVPTNVVVPDAPEQVAEVTITNTVNPVGQSVLPKTGDHLGDFDSVIAIITAICLAVLFMELCRRFDEEE